MLSAEKESALSILTRESTTETRSEASFTFQLEHQHEQIKAVAVFSDGTVWRGIRYKQGNKWQCDITLNRPDGTTKEIHSVLSVSKDGNTHTYQNSDGSPPGLYHRLAK